MKYSKYPFKTLKKDPADELSRNAKLLIRAGFAYKEMAGVYSLLPFGVKVLNKIVTIIEKEMNSIGGMQTQMSTLQKKERWEKVNRWDDNIVDNWFKTKLKNGQELGLAYTHEAAFADMLTNYTSSYKDLPIALYEFRKIYRNELRAKSGLMRGREFFWKAMYSFSKNEDEHNEFYEKAKKAYINIFDNVGLGDKTFLTFASGGTFSKYSHEFQTLSEAGEDIIYLHREKNIAINREVFNDKVLLDLNLKREELEEVKAIEVGNIFSLAHSFTKPLDLKFIDDKGNSNYIYMGSYGIGITRLIGTIVEVLSDEKGIIWPKSVSPFDMHLIDLGEDSVIKKETKILYEALLKSGFDVLWDDRDISAGEKFADADLIGLPFRLVVSAKTLKGYEVEIKKRGSDKLQFAKISDIVKVLKNL